MKIPRWVKLGCFGTLLLGGLAVAGLIGFVWYVKNQMLDSGGVLLPEQAAYDVRHYDLELKIDPETQSIEGRNLATVEALSPLDEFVIHLDDRLEVGSVTVDGRSAAWKHRRGLIRVVLDGGWRTGHRAVVGISYRGEPKVALQPPWIDGFVWEKTPSGEHWIGVTSQGSGGDSWWPCKDHPSDEPDEGMSIALTVPSSLVGLTNGRRLSETENPDGTTTTRWRVHYPINNYGVSLAIGPYRSIEERYHGVDGTLDVPILYWTIPEHEAKARAMWTQAPRILKVLGRRFGEYPFLDDKFWVVDSPYKGMEHQTLIAYGGNYANNRWGFEDLLLHETAHEWWGNKISVDDWSDFWIQEGFTTYAEAVYVNDTRGVDDYLDYMARFIRGTRNKKPIIQGENYTASQAYQGDIYVKGAAVLHTLRYLLGDQAFFELLHGFSTDPRFAYRLVSMENWTAYVEEATGRDLQWFWQRYIYTADLPSWELSRQGDQVTLAWQDTAFAMPLPIRVDGRDRHLSMEGGQSVFTAAPEAVILVDPDGWVLEASDREE